MREIERLIDSFGDACAAQGRTSAAATRARADLLTLVERRAPALLPWDLPVRVLAAIRVDGALDHFLGIRPSGSLGEYTAVELRWTARAGPRYWNLASAEAVLRELHGAGALQGVDVDWLDGEARRVWEALEAEAGAQTSADEAATAAEPPATPE